MATGLSLVGGGAFWPPSELAPEREQGELCALPVPAQPTLGELFAASPRDGGATGFLLAQLGPLSRERPLLWVQERMAILEAGRIYPPGLGAQGLGAQGLGAQGFGPDLIHVEARDARAALWAMEEGLRCSALGGVIGELWGDPRALDFTATRRLAVAAERSGVPAWLVRFGGTANLSGARMRWRVASAPSLAHEFDPRAPGAAAWDAELFRARGAAPGRWPRCWSAGGDGAADFERVVAVAADRAVAADEWKRA